MRAQVRTQNNSSLSAQAVSLSLYVKYYNESESFTGFPGGRTFYHYSSVTKPSRYYNDSYSK